MFAAAALAAGSLLKANAAYQQGKAESKLHGINERMARWQAKEARALGRQDVARLREQAAQILGGQRVGFAGMNVALDTGAPAMIAEDTERIAALDAITALNNAARRAFGFQVEAVSQNYQGRLAKYAGKQKAIGSLLGGAADIAGLPG